MNRIFTLFSSSLGLRQTAVTVVGNTLASGLAAVALILISRMLGPSGFGEFTVGFSIILILAKLNDAGLSATISRFAAETTDKHIISTVFSLTTQYKLLLSVVILAAGLSLSGWLNTYLAFNNVWLIRGAFIFSLANIYYEHLLYLLLSVHRFTEAVWANVLQAATKVAGITVFWLLGQKQVPVIFAWYSLVTVIPLLVGRWFLPAWVKIDLRVRNPRYQGLILNMAKHASVALISAGIIENIDVLFVQKFLSTYETGLLGGVGRIAMMIALVGYSLGNVLNPRVARYKDAVHLRLYLKKAWSVVGLSLLGFLAFIPLGEIAIRLTIGAEYIPGLSVLLILAAAAFLTIATIPFIALFYSYRANWYFSVSGLLQLIIVVVGNLVLVPHYGLAAAAWTRLVSRVVLFTFTLVAGLYIYRLKYGQTQANSSS